MEDHKTQKVFHKYKLYFQITQTKMVHPQGHVEIDNYNQDPIQTLQVATGYPQITSLSLAYLDLDEVLNRGILQLVRSRIWKQLSIYGCWGHVDELLKGMFELDRVERLTFKTLRPENRVPAFTELAAGLQKTKTLTLLDVGSGHISKPGALALAQGLRHCTSIQTLNIDMLRMTGHDALDGARVLASAIASNPTIQTLHVFCTSDTDLIQKSILEQLTNRPCPLEELHLGRICTPWAICKVVTLLECNKLHRLDVSCVRNNAFPSCRNVDVMPIIHALSTNTSLQVLDLSVNQITDDEVLSLLDILQTNSTLKALDLSYNRISDQGLFAIASTMPRLSLKRLAIKGNMFGPDGASQLLEAMSIESNIEQVDMDDHLPVSAEIAWIARLNKGGRRVLLDPTFPLSLWPLILERINCLEFGGAYHPCIGRAEIEFYLVRYGPVLFEQKS
jgi:Ran GTPase-activating protein (RanGAP) involved in mRNA processing and transport